MVDAILLDKRQVLPCAVHLRGEYGIDGLFSGVPARLGAGGLLEVFEVDLDDTERAALHRSADAVREVVEIIEKNRAEIDPNLPSLLVGATA
jgi:malate dehydrogenase